MRLRWSPAHRARLPALRRLPNEFYPTRPEAVRALLSVEPFDGAIWEPACGKGTIVSINLYPYGFGESGVDFLKQFAARARPMRPLPPPSACCR